MSGSLVSRSYLCVLLVEREKKRKKHEVLVSTKGNTMRGVKDGR